MIRAALVTESISGNGFNPYHCHREIEINHFLSGSGTYSITGEPHDIRHGDTYIFTNNVIHRITMIDPTEEMRILKVHFNPEILWNAGENSVFRDFLDVIYNKDTGSAGDLKINGSSLYSAQICDILGKMYKEYKQQQYKYEEMLSGYLLDIIVFIMRSSGVETHNRQHSFNSENYKAVCRTIDFISSNLSQTLKVSSLAALANMSQNNYLIQFRRFTGTSPYNFILSKRISASVDMLRNETLPITEIAYRCGFNNTVSFNKAFRSIMDKTPSEIRSNN